jgi:hypothetical protein
VKNVLRVRKLLASATIPMLGTFCAAFSAQALAAVTGVSEMWEESPGIGVYSYTISDNVASDKVQYPQGIGISTDANRPISGWLNVFTWFADWPNLPPGSQTSIGGQTVLSYETGLWELVGFHFGGYGLTWVSGDSLDCTGSPCQP